MTTLPEPPRAPLVDARTGGLTREWTRFFDDLRKAIISSLDEGFGGRLERLELDTLFDGGDGGSGGGGSSYNDTAVNARLDSLETELLWLATDRAEGQTDGSELELDLSELMMTPDSAGAIQRLTRAVRELELAQVMAADAAGRVAALAHRLNTLETETLFSR